ncbi:hypothetical protein [Ochrobactrum sp. Marseille-Q0166]|uniref:hypothetical protein n=1 Tax=Ochrobactrum sp. Marseille-Q0166 TaxID=2761105 RepID=UPI00165613F4|nr:hypothetical protein [Ochrobactrum sp. Marseille-Q0166]MBC8719176.1 hypothetical protein [Ochrobactrum sp. Marseille-Q0166]
MKRAAEAKYINLSDDKVAQFKTLDMAKMAQSIKKYLDAERNFKDDEWGQTAF